MSKCTRCGYTAPLNPFKILLTFCCQLMMLWFLSNVTPDAGAWGGVPNFFIHWHRLMWWFTATFAGISMAIFFIEVAILVIDRRETKSA